MAFSWANPQNEYGLNILLARQNWKCNACQYDYGPLVSQLLTNGRVYNKPADHNIQMCPSLALRIKQHSPEGTKPEVDHIIPISKGGQSIGFDNLQTICVQCHKAKTKVDNSGPRKKKE